MYQDMDEGFCVVMHGRYNGWSRGKDDGGRVCGSGVSSSFVPVLISPSSSLYPSLFSPPILSLPIPFSSLSSLPPPNSLCPLPQALAGRGVQLSGLLQDSWLDMPQRPPPSLLYLPNLGNSGKTIACDARSTSVQIPALPLISCVTSGKWLSISEPQLL